jgi:predicted metalloprotease
MLLRLDELRWLAGDEVRVSGDVVDDEGDMERPERLGEKAVRRRWREPVRMGVKGDWKRLVRVGETISIVVMVRKWVGCCIRKTWWSR